MKVCILANSHAHALRLAAQERTPKWRPVFFAAPANRMRRIRLTGGRLVARDAGVARWMDRTSGGVREVVLRDYDAFVICGLSLRALDGLRMFCDHQPVGRRVSDDVALVSEAAFRAAVRDRIQASAGARLMQLLKDRKPVLIVPAPMPSVRIAELPEFDWINRPGGAEAVRWISGIVLEEIRALADERGFRFMPQPPETLDERGLTRLEYAEDAVRFTGSAYSEDDISHMNTAYGALILHSIGGALGWRAALPHRWDHRLQVAARRLRKFRRRCLSLIQGDRRPETPAVRTA